MEDCVIEFEVMSSDADEPDLLSRAIGEFREGFLLWIDAELVRLRERESEESLVMEEGSAAPSSSRSGLGGGSPLGSRASRPAARPGRPDLPAEIGWQTPRNRGKAAGRDSVAETAWPPVAPPGPESDPEPQPPPSDSRQRLDALARLLDHRLKRAQGAAGTMNGAAGGTSQGVEDEAS
jgi:hypothetical protein